MKTLPKRVYGKTGIRMPVLALGGAGVFGNITNRKLGVEIIREAVESGVEYLDTAQQYRDSEDIFGEAIEGIRSRVFLSTKSDKRTYDGAKRELESSLRRLRTDRLDQWIVHHVSYPHEVERLFAKDGAMRAFQEAKEQKVVRFLGVSGHNDPAVLITMLERFPFDMVLFPLNPTEVHHPKSFMGDFFKLAQKQKLGLAVMKVMGIGRLVGQGKLTVSEAVHYALSHSIHTAVILCNSLQELREVVGAVREYKPLKPDQLRALEERARPLTQEIAGVYHTWP